MSCYPSSTGISLLDHQSLVNSFVAWPGNHWTTSSIPSYLQQRSLPCCLPAASCFLLHWNGILFLKAGRIILKLLTSVFIALSGLHKCTRYVAMSSFCRHQLDRSLWTNKSFQFPLALLGCTSILVSCLIHNSCSARKPAERPSLFFCANCSRRTCRCFELQVSHLYS